MARIGDQTTRPGDFRCASYASMAGAFLFMLSFIFFLSAFLLQQDAEAKKQDHFANYTRLDPKIVYDLWESRRKSQTEYLMGELTASLGWVSLLPAVGTLGHVAGGQDARSAVRFMTACFQGAAMVSVIDFTFQAGLHSMTDWLSTWPIMKPDYSACPDDDGDCGQHDWQDDDEDKDGPCHALCPDGVCNSMTDHDKPECKACAECHDHDGDGQPDHGHDDHPEGQVAHDDMSQDMEAGGAAATSFVKYFDYAGSLAVKGSVRATELNGLIHQMWYDLEGVDGGCDRGPDTSVKNSCGIHIHKGTSCAADALGHLHNAEADPWGVGVYTATSFTSAGVFTAKSWFTVPNTGLSTADIMGKTVIVHGKDGGRIACAILRAPAPAGPNWHANDGGFGPLQALELDYLVAGSRTLWLFALDELLLAAGWSTAAYLAYSSAQLSSRWGHLSVFGACVAVIGFIFAIVRMFMWRPFAQIYLFTAALVDFLILPVWILWLATQLRNLSSRGAYASNIEFASALTVGATNKSAEAEADANVV